MEFVIDGSDNKPLVMILQKDRPITWQDVITSHENINDTEALCLWLTEDNYLLVQEGERKMFSYFYIDYVDDNSSQPCIVVNAAFHVDNTSLNTTYSDGLSVPLYAAGSTVQDIPDNLTVTIFLSLYTDPDGYFCNKTWRDTNNGSAVNYTLPNEDNLNTTVNFQASSKSCVYWDESLNDWQKSGCLVSVTNNIYRRSYFRFNTIVTCIHFGLLFSTLCDDMAYWIL